MELENVLMPWTQIPPPENLNQPFILDAIVGNGSENNPITIVISTHGLL